MEKDLEQRVKFKELQQYATNLEVDVNVVQMYQALYHQHKVKHGSYKKHIQDGELYDKLMKERDEWIYNQIEEVIDCKYEMGWKDVRDD